MNNTSTPVVPENILKNYPTPLTGQVVVFDTFECYDFQEERVNMALSLGFEPYAVTHSEIDMREEAKAKMKLHQIPVYLSKRWFRRARAIDAKPVEINTILKESHE